MNRLAVFSFVLIYTLASYGLSFSQPTPLKADTARIFPHPTWQSVDASSQGWNRRQLAQLSQFIRDSAQTTGMLIIHQGYVVFTYGNVEEVSYIASCRKSILAMLYGPFVESGRIQLDQPIEQLGLDDIGGLLPIEKQATIRHLLTARSGVYHPASNSGDNSVMAPPRGSRPPGSFWLYNNWDFNVTGSILEQQTEQSIYELIDSLLAKPLQMQDWHRDRQQKHGDTTLSRYPAYHMWFSTRDMARLGYLMLRRGNWQGQQVVPACWIKTITSVVTPYPEALAHHTNYFTFGYGYLWWIWDMASSPTELQGAYTASGAYGQFITVVPKMDVVIAHKTSADNHRRNTPTEMYLQIVNRVVAAGTMPNTTR